MTLLRSVALVIGLLPGMVHAECERAVARYQAAEDLLRDSLRKTLILCLFQETKAAEHLVGAVGPKTFSLTTGAG